VNDTKRSIAETLGSPRLWAPELLRRALMATVVGLPLLYLGDYISLRYGLPPRDTFDVVKVEQYYAVPRKDGRLEYYTDDPVDQRCVRSLFPHMGLSPCWYLRRGSEKRTNL
jgi:hypothetical protein